MIKINWKNQMGEKMVVNHKGDVVFLTWPALAMFPFVRHCFSTRKGGVSEGFFSSMNLSFTRGDDEKAVRENYERLAKAVGFRTEDIVCSDQTHTANIRVVTEEDRGKGIVRERDYEDIDGMITNVPGIVLAAFFADCVPIYLVDPVTRSIGLLHSGWKGTVKNIIKNGVRAMKKAYGSKPGNILAAIGPSICGSCYEIGEDVASVFREAYPAAQYREMVRDDRNGKYHLDLQKACRFNLLGSGVLSENIFDSNLCTCCNPEFLFSHRASGGRRGNLGAFLQIKEEAVKQN
ncbi:MAG: peptidoglycan editing factor PgeF [Ruminococcus sp.]|jgi:YfiH family protein